MNRSPWISKIVHADNISFLQRISTIWQIPQICRVWQISPSCRVSGSRYLVTLQNFAKKIKLQANYTSCVTLLSRFVNPSSISHAQSMHKTDGGASVLFWPRMHIDGSTIFDILVNINIEIYINVLLIFIWCFLMPSVIHKPSWNYINDIQSAFHVFLYYFLIFICQIRIGIYITHGKLESKGKHWTYDVVPFCESDQVSERRNYVSQWVAPREIFSRPHLMKRQRLEERTWS